MEDKARKAVAALNRGLYEHIASFPRARTELVDFYFKHAVESYVAAIQTMPGQTLVISAPTSADATAAIRRAALLCDVVVLRVASHIGNPALALLPIGDEVASPVLGAMAIIDPATGKYRFPTPQEYMYSMSLRILAEPESSSVVNLLGRPFNSGAAPEWHRTTFSRTSQDYLNAQGRKCHIAAGPIHVQIPKEDTLLEDAERMMRSGRVVYAPFLSLPDAADDVTEGVLKAELMRGNLAVLGGPISTNDLVLDLQVPYLENVPLNVLSQVLDDEGESVTAFRREIRRAIEDVERAKDRSDAEKRITQLTRDLFEDELDKVRRTCERVARMNAIARIGAYVSVGSLAVAAHFGLAPASAITGGAGVAAATLSALWRNHEDTHDVRRSPMHFVWHLRDLVRGHA